jgi:hypothetical protein
LVTVSIGKFKFIHIKHPYRRMPQTLELEVHARRPARAVNVTASPEVFSTD